MSSRKRDRSNVLAVTSDGDDSRPLGDSIVPGLDGEDGPSNVIPVDAVPNGLESGYPSSGSDVGAEGGSGVVGEVVTVFAPKGGSGKTTVSTNLAVALHADGARRVCLIDLDLEFGDVAISLGLTPVRTLIDAVTADASGTEDEALRLLVTEFRPGLDCILAPIEPGDAEKIPADLVTDLVALLRTRYDYVVIDTPSQLTEFVLAALDASDHFVLLANPEIPSLKNLRLALDMLDMLGYPRSKRTIVFNRADDAAGLTTADVEDALRTPITISVPASRDVPASINRGMPIVASKPDHAVSTAIKKLAIETIVGDHRGATRRRPKLFRRHSG